MEEVKNYYAGRHLISMKETHISMQEGTSLVCRKTGKTGEDHNPDKFAELLLLTYRILEIRLQEQTNLKSIFGVQGV